MFCEAKCTARSSSKSLRRKREFMDTDEWDLPRQGPGKKLHSCNDS